MAAHPTGTVTFLFTDVVGSTRLWEEHPDEMQAALERHDEILRSVIDAHGGYVFSTAGDAFAAAFARAGDALTVAAKAQEALDAAAWPAEARIRVRMGVHTGEAQERDGDYFGSVVNRAARIMSAGHGGQVLLSAVTGMLVGDGFVLRELGSHRLKDLSTPEALLQLGVETFPAPRTLETVRNNLPVQRSELFGREGEVVEVSNMLGLRRLVTLTGVGGVGKTRLALAAAAELVDQFPDGVFFAELASLSEAAQVAPAVAEAVGVSIGPFDVESVATRLAGREMLLVLDNCEHLIDDVADLVDILLSSGSRCRVLATSREALEVEGEHTFTVPSLESSTESSPAARLMLDRALAARPALAIDDGAMAALVEVCVRLDGIPLALELAAAQLTHLSPEDLADRLDDRFRLLVGGRRRRLQRQQTLQAVMDWSWDLLEAPERELLAQLSVFAGGWTLEAAEGVCRIADQVPVLGVLGSLTAKSLIRVEPAHHHNRYRMLETVRLYGLGKLLDAGQTEPARARHARYFCSSAASVPVAERFTNVPAAAAWRQETGNIRSAVDWLRDHNRLAEAAALVTMPALGWRGSAVGHEVGALLGELLDQELSERDRGLVLLAEGEFGWGNGDLGVMGRSGREAADIGRRVGDAAMTSAGLWLEGITLQVGDPDRAEELLVEAGRLGAEAGDRRLEASALAMIADVEAMGRRRFDEARRFVDRARSLASPDGFENLVIAAAESTIALMSKDWSAASHALDRVEQVMTELEIGGNWVTLVERSVVNAELGRSDDRPLNAAAAALVAAGGIADRPDLALIPLGVACAAEDWKRAGEIIAAIQAAGRHGISFASPHTTAIYLIYRDAMPRHAVASNPRPFDELIKYELAREADEPSMNKGHP